MSRTREILSVFWRYGFGPLLREAGWRGLPFRRPPVPESMSRGERLRRALEELGPAFVKAGQMLSTRADLLPEDVLEELALLQDRVPPDPFPAIRQVVEEELGRPLPEVFPRFDPQPLGSASLAQVHLASLPDGREVVVKVQRPGVRERVETDLELLLRFARLAERRTVWGRMYRVGETAEEVARAVREELDYRLEAGRVELFRRKYRHHPRLAVPAVHRELTTQRVLTMERIEGFRLGELPPEADRQALATLLVTTLLRQILKDGVFHADPHPGNLLFVPQDGTYRLAFLDFGMVGRLGSPVREALVALVLALLERDSHALLRSLRRLGAVPPEVDVSSLRRDLEVLRDRYLDLPLSQISLSEVTRSLFALAYRHRLHIPSELALVGRALLTLEGVAVRLDPGVRVVELAEPLGRELLRERLSSRGLLRRLGREAARAVEDLFALPDLLRDFAEHLRRGTLPLALELGELERFLRKLDQVASRLSLSLLLLAYSVLMAGVIVAWSLKGQSSLLWRVPVLEIGFFFASLLFAWILWSIVRGGQGR